MSTKRPKILVIAGPTASGKTSLSIALAKRFNGEIISADSRQVYRKLDIGTAKATPEEMGKITHHLIDVADIDQVYNANDFKTAAAEAITDITDRSKLPIIAGGTFFYVDVLLSKTTTPEVPPNPTLRAELSKKSTDELLKLLQEKDPHRAATVDAENPRRLIRSLEIVAALGTVPEAKVEESPYDVLTIGIKTEKESLREKFRLRAEDWTSGPFEEEVRELLDSGVTRERLQEIGFEYLLMLAYIDGQLDKESFIQRCIEKNWQYAKRQRMWLKRDDSIQWFDKDDKEIFTEVEKFVD